MSSSYHQGHVEHSLRGLAYLSRPAPDPGPTHLIPGETRAQGGSTNVATSRTGTARHKNLRAQTIHDARQAGQTQCPICRHLIDWDGPRGLRSPEMDHIIPIERGGKDVRENARITCGDCNRKRRSRERLARMATVKDPIVTSQAW